MRWLRRRLISGVFQSAHPLASFRTTVRVVQYGLSGRTVNEHYVNEHRFARVRFAARLQQTILLARHVSVSLLHFIRGWSHPSIGVPISDIAVDSSSENRPN